MDTEVPSTSNVIANERDDKTRPSVSSHFRDGFLQKNAVLLLTLLGVVLGFVIGFSVRPFSPSRDTRMWIGMPGELFLRMLNFLIVPLVVSSIITGTASLNPKSNSKITIIAFSWITATNIISCIVAVVLSIFINPGSGGSVSKSAVGNAPFETQDIFADLLRNLVPNNIAEVAFRKAQTQYSEKAVSVLRTLANGTVVTVSETVRVKSNSKTDSVNVLGLIFVSAVLGVAANQLGEKARVFVQFFAASTDIVLTVLRWFFWSTPLGVASLIAKSVSGIDDLQDSFSKLGKFVFVVVLGLLIFQLFVLPLLFFALTRKDPYMFHLSIMRPYIIGFASTSTAVAIPEMLHCCEVKNKIDPRVARFAIPFSSAISANGSAIFIVSAAIFIAQYIGFPLEISDVIVIGILTAVSAMAIPSVPSASIVTLIIILAALSIPSDKIALLFTVEWFLDRLRTGTNVVSHCMCAAVTYRFVMKDLELQDREVMEVYDVETSNYNPPKARKESNNINTRPDQRKSSASRDYVNNPSLKKISTQI